MSSHREASEDCDEQLVDSLRCVWYFVVFVDRLPVHGCILETSKEQWIRGSFPAGETGDFCRGGFAGIGRLDWIAETVSEGAVRERASSTPCSPHSKLGQLGSCLPDIHDDPRPPLVTLGKLQCIASVMETTG